MIAYQQYPPCPLLEPYVACLWTCHVQVEGQALAHRVLPDNCIDILWQDCDPLGGVAGMMSKHVLVPFARPVRTLAVRFKPGAASYFFDLPMHELTDLHPALADVWKDGLVERLADALCSRALPDSAALAVIEQMLLQRLRTSQRRPGLVEAAIGSIERSRGAIRIEALASSLGVSRQHLASQFQIRVGLSAKLFARVCRFQHASASLRHGAPRNLAALALELGYYDQAHMTHEFGELGGCTPQSFGLP